MAVAKAEMQLLPPLQISDPFSSFPHSPPTMDSNYPKLEEMMLLSGGGPQFLTSSGAPENSGFNPPGEQHFEHLAAGKRQSLSAGGWEWEPVVGTLVGKCPPPPPEPLVLGRCRGALVGQVQFARDSAGLMMHQPRWLR